MRKGGVEKEEWRGGGGAEENRGRGWRNKEWGNEEEGEALEK